MNIKNIDNIIKESLHENLNRLILNEALTSIVYHFTSPRKLYNILKADTFYLQSSFRASADDMSKKKFFMSLTRQKSGELGYSRGKDVRITLDGDLLNQRYEGGPVDYWGASKQKYFKKKEEGGEIDYFQPSTENEDRLYSNEPAIYDFHRYIKRIDILADNEYDLPIIKKCWLSKFRNLIHVYDNKKDFNYQTDNEINEKMFEVSDSINLNSSMRNVELNSISDVLNFMILFKGISKKDEIKYASMLLKQYGLERYMRVVIPKIKNNNKYSLNDFTLSISFDDLYKSDDKEAYANTAKMFRDFLKENKLKDERDAKIKFQKNMSYNNYDKIDYNKVVKLFVFNKYGNEKYILPHPETTSFWDLFPNSRDDFRLFVERHIYSHKSRDDESFTKYLQHLQKNEIPLLKMIDIINKFDMDDEYKQELLDDSTYGYEDMDYNKALYGYNNFLNDEQQSEVVNMFKSE